MADHSSPPLQQPKTLSQMIVQPWFATVHLIHYLTLLPNALDSEAVLTELCTRDFLSIFSYLFSLGYTHWHRQFLMTQLQDHFQQMSVNKLTRQIVPLIPAMTALWYDPQEQQTFPIMGPLTEPETVRWDIHTWFYRFLHSKQMTGQFCQLFGHFRYCVSILTYTHLELRFP